MKSIVKTVLPLCLVVSFLFMNTSCKKECDKYYNSMLEENDALHTDVKIESKEISTEESGL